MNKQMKDILLVGILILLLSACGQFETASAPESAVAVNPTPGAAAVSTEKSAPDKFNKYVGLNYPPIPAGLTEGFSMMIQGTEDHGLWLVTEGTDQMLWLTEITHYDSDGTAYWEVKDVLGLSNLEAGLVLIPDGCFLNAAPDPEIIIVGKDETVLLAWRANTALDSFEVIPTNGIECRSDKGWNLE
jgi:hypothetical protein